MGRKEKQLKNLQLALLMTGIATGLVLLFWCYVNFLTGPLANAEKEMINPLYGLSVIVFMAALSCAYSFINFNNLRKLKLKDPDHMLRSAFLVQTERFISGAQGVMVVTVIMFLYWLIYSRVTNITYYQDASDQFQSFTQLNTIWLALMLIATIFSVMAGYKAFQVKNT